MNRRSFFQKGFLGLLSLPLIKQTHIFQSALAADACPAAAPSGKKLIKADDKAAMRLKFVMDAKTAKHPKYKAGNQCDNCKQYKVKKGEEGLHWAPCAMLAMKYVPSCGWCMQYLKKA